MSGRHMVIMGKLWKSRVIIEISNLEYNIYLLLDCDFAWKKLFHLT